MRNFHQELLREKDEEIAALLETTVEETEDNKTRTMNLKTL